MTKKGLSIWLFSTLAFASLVHMAEAAYTMIFNGEIKLLQLYPFIGQQLQNVPATTYFWISASATLIFWGITCAVAFDSPVEQFLNKILSDAKKQSMVETQLVEEKSEILDAMYESIESGNETLAHVRDMMFNVRTEVKEIRPMTENMEKMKTELANLKKEVKRLEEKPKLLIQCSACGKTLQPDFKLCPYCGQNIKLLPEALITLKEYK